MQQVRPNVKIIQDKRWKTKTGPAAGMFPVKIRISFRIGSDKYAQPCYPSNLADNSYFYLHEFDFLKIQADKARGDLAATAAAIERAKNKVTNILDDAPFISPEIFDAIYYGKANRQTQINILFDEFIALYKKLGQISNYRSYQSAKNSLNKYSAGLTFAAIDKDFLNGYEREMTGSGKSITTVAIYLRNLRHIFNEAIDRELVNHKYYPFGKRGYVIPETENFKKAQTKDDYQKLLDYHFDSEPKEFHLSLHKLSYYLLGMNMADIAFLKKENLSKDTVSYFRRKTRNTLRVKKPVTIPYHPEAKRIIDKYGIHKPYLLGILHEGKTEINVKNKIASLLKKIASAVEDACNDIGMDSFDFYTAKHTASTRLIQNKIDMKTLQELHGHTKITTTERYIKSLGMDEQRELVKSIL